MGLEHRTRSVRVGGGRLALLVAVVLVAGGLNAAAALSAPAPASAFVRVNQVGYPRPRPSVPI
jgi:hypothetical protein